eukprot:SAG31_NODE_1165_length_9578_cov_5.386011_3_plen_49_part_00
MADHFVVQTLLVVLAGLRGEGYCEIWFKRAMLQWRSHLRKSVATERTL